MYSKLATVIKFNKSKELVRALSLFLNSVSSTVKEKPGKSRKILFFLPLSLLKIRSQILPAFDVFNWVS